MESGARVLHGGSDKFVPPKCSSVVLEVHVQAGVRRGLGTRSTFTTGFMNEPPYFSCSY